MRLLLAEDERELSNSLTTILKHNHYSIDTVYDGESALDRLNFELFATKGSFRLASKEFQKSHHRIQRGRPSALHHHCF